MDTSSLLIKLSELAPFVNWYHNQEDRYLSQYITGKFESIEIHIEIGLLDRDFEVSMTNGRVSYRSTHDDINQALDNVLRMAFNCVMARIVYGDQKGFMRWVESLKEICNS